MAIKYGSCSNKGRGAPSGNAAIMYSEYFFDENIRAVITSLIGNIDNEALNANGNAVRYQGRPNLKAYANLVRDTASQIGCAWNRCGENYIMFCLTNQPQLRNNQGVYSVGSRVCECPSGKKCDMWEGLCK
ncbi:hypothetical protein OESDEN_09775 [Oesophagostomum dentatum]|uniref:SCP domain-containing protein n=1 Tax=Oesophagostomum dentatum TaxID=61180 RepID=A0A0B1T3K7_OESDE|nr:hypothetical protein OESDEN_09775 [Oesophagostomum dentatum]